MEEIPKESINTYKGELLRSLYADKEGKIILTDLPYDTYLIEIEDSKSYQQTAIPLKFNTISVSKDKLIKKYIGLKEQTSAYLEVYVYEQGGNNNIENNINTEMKHIPEAEVYLKKCKENIDNYLMDDLEGKFKIVENTKTGRFESNLVVGNYIVEAYKKGYNNYRKEINLTNGLNKVNIELKKQDKSRKITVQAVNYPNIETFVENVHLKVKLYKFIYYYSFIMVIKMIRYTKGSLINRATMYLNHMKILII
jgi:hypothetical protein